MTADTRIAIGRAARHRPVAGDRPFPLHTDDHHLSWTQLGIRMGFTRDESQRVQILDGIARMAWAETAVRHHNLGGPAARAIARAIIGPHPDQHRRVGIARLDDGRRLIGLEHALGTRSFVLDLGAEAVHLLDAVNDRQPRIA